MKNNGMKVLEHTNKHKFFKNNKKGRKKTIRSLVLLAICLIFLLILFDMRLKTVTYQVSTDKVDKEIKIALFTDLHGEWYGKNQQTLIHALDAASPDLVLFGGDMFTENKKYDHTILIMQELSKKYPCYYVTGNHEYWSGDIDNILSIVNDTGVNILSGGACDVIEINGQTINLCGVDDPDGLMYQENISAITEQLRAASDSADRTNYTILLSHRPELIKNYSALEFDLVLSGHAHGGQWRIPYVLNGLYAPNQGLFPEYAGGKYESRNTTMIVSRGLSRITTFPPRILNRPELVIIELCPN